MRGNEGTHGSSLSKQQMSSLRVSAGGYADQRNDSHQRLPVLLQRQGKPRVSPDSFPKRAVEELVESIVCSIVLKDSLESNS